jgi:hypothetical protein
LLEVVGDVVFGGDSLDEVEVAEQGAEVLFQGGAG